MNGIRWSRIASAMRATPKLCPFGPCLLVSLVSIQPAIGQTGNAETGLVGSWEGMLFIGGYYWRFMEAEFRPQDNTITANIGLPQDTGYSVARFEFPVPRIVFRLTRGTSALDFEGEIRSETIVGTVVGGQGRGVFQLIRVTRPPSFPAEKYAGLYQQSGGEFISVTPFNFGDGKERLAYMNTATGHWGILLPAASNSFYFGPARFAPFPVDLQVSFQRDGTGQAHVLRWKRKNGATGAAERKNLYIEEPAEFWNGDVKLSGTLVKPNTIGPHPGIVMIHSSGHQSRSGPAGYFRLLANLFTTRGIAVLVYDKRGVGASAGNWNEASFDDLAVDALAGLEWLKKRSGVDRSRIGLWGLSQGGWLAPLAASKSKDVAFLALVGAPAVSPAQQEIDRKLFLLKTDGFSLNEIAEAHAYMNRFFSFVRTGEGWEEMHRGSREASQKRWGNYVVVPDSPQDPNVEWWRRSQIDPERVLPALSCPTLTIHGRLDEDVDGKMNSDLFQKLVRSPGSEHLLYPDADHHVLVRPNQGEQDYPRLANEYLNDMLEWIVERSKTSME